MRKNLLFLFALILSLIMVACTDAEIEFSFSESEVTIKVGDTYTLDYELTENYDIEFTMSVPDIVSISEDTITALAVGEVIVTATIVGQDISDSITIIVEAAEPTHIEVTSIIITGPSSGLVGETLTLSAEVLPGNATDKVVTWTSSNTTVATVNDGVVTLLRPGVIYVTATADGLAVTHDIIITAIYVPVVSVEVTGPSDGLVGEEITLTTEVLPANASLKAVTWKSSDESIATVTDGIVKLLAAGTVTITATADGISDTHEIVISAVIIDVESVTVSGEAAGFVGETITLTADILPQNSTNTNVVWSTSDAELATVADGEVALLAPGVVTITATIDGFSDSIEITISKVAVEMITITGDESGIVGESITLTANLMPLNATFKDVVWASSDEALATVTDGVVTLLGAGTVTISATADGVTETFEIIIEPAPIVVESIEIVGDSSGFIGDEINLTVNVFPQDADTPEIVWSVNLNAFATVENGVVSLHRTGTAIITATADGIFATFEVTILRAAAMINDSRFATIQGAIDAAVSGDVIEIIGGSHHEILTINKSNISFVPVEGHDVLLTNLITISGNRENISFEYLGFTGHAQIKSIGTLKGFNFKHNHVFDTALQGSGYLPINRVNVNAFIQFYRLADAELFGNINIEENHFENIQSDIISLDRTMVNTEINIQNNTFKNFKISAIRFDGGWNNGTYNIKYNTFENDIMSGFSAISFRAFAPSSGNTQNIYIEFNNFTNIGEISKNRDGDQPGSGVITFSTFNGNATNIFIRDNMFEKTFNSIHLRGGANNWSATVSGNTFTDVIGYVYFESVKLATYADNLFYDRLGEPIESSRLVLNDASTFRFLQIAAPVLESFTIVGDDTGETGDEIVLALEATPPYFVFDQVVWTSSDVAVATVENGKVQLLQVGTVTIFASYGEITETFEITITEKMAAFIGEVGYLTIQDAINAADAGDSIFVNKGEFSQNLTINKSIHLYGHDNHLSVLSGKVTIAPNLTNISIQDFSMTGNFQVVSTGTLKGFSFVNNFVYDTNLLSSGYVPNSRTNVNAIIQLYAGAGTNVFGDISIENNVFDNIQSDIINIDRTMVDSQILIRYNDFLNFKVGAIRFDGGYNNGTYEIVDNVFSNDVKQGETAILFRAYSPSSGNLQTINITDNVFRNIGNEANNPTATHPASAVIAASTYNSFNIDFNILRNTFINTHNSVHLRKNEVQTKAVWDVDIVDNVFEDTTGYIYYEDSNVALFADNTILIQGVDVDPARISMTQTASQTLISVLPELAEYVVITYTYNAETDTYDIVESFNTGVVGALVVINANPPFGFFTEFDKYEGVIQADGSLVIEIYYEVFMDSFIYELEFNGGNTIYADRDDMVNDWLADYNTFGNTAYTINTIPRDTFGSSINIHTFFFDARFRDKWLWVAQYLSVVGSSTNRPAAANIVSRDSVAAFNAVNDNYRFAFSYEVRGFMDGRKFVENANWQSSDYSVRELKFGFWSYFLAARQETEFLSQEAVVVLPTQVYLENYEFMGWYDNADFNGEPITEITSEGKLYAKWLERNPVSELTIMNPVTEMFKGDTLTLDVSIAPQDAFNKLLLFYTSDSKVLTVTPEGLLTAMNAGTAVITVTNHNGEVVVTMDVTVYPKDDIVLEFSAGFNGYINVGNEFTMTAVGFGKENTDKVYTYVPEEDGTLELIGTNTFKALQSGSTFIDVFDGLELVYTYQVIVQAPLSAESRVDALLMLLANANNSVVSGLNVITYYTASQEWSDPRYESVNLFLFDDYVVDRTSFPADPTRFSNRLMSSVEFVLVHDTANLNSGLMSHGSFFANPANSVGIHYTTGDYGILASLPDNYVGWHAGDGTTQNFSWIPTGIMATNEEPPFIDISTDGFFTFNGQKSTVQAPRGRDNQILDRSYFTFQGPNWDIFNGQYVIGTTWFATSQQSRGVIASRGGNLNSIGIEMNVNRNGDIIDTVQRTAKLVANLLEENNLSNSRVIMHNTTDGKGDPYTFNNTIYKGTWYFDRFMEHVAVEREVLKNYPDATITFSSDSPLVSSTGRVISMPEMTTEVEYTITVEIDGVSKSITLVSVIPGVQTWNQNYGFFSPTQPWSKADYRK